MDFGRLHGEDLHARLDAIDWELPADDPRNAAVLAGAARDAAAGGAASIASDAGSDGGRGTGWRAAPSPVVCIGSPEWTARSYTGVIYPPGTPPAQRLSLYTRHFSGVELNATYYALPSTATLQRWRAAAGPGFRFCPKLTRHISARLDTAAARALSARFFAAIAELGDHRGECFLQLPSSFTAARNAQLAAYMERLPSGLALSVEARHPSWFADPARRDGLFSLLREHGCGAVVTDVAGRRDVVHARLTCGRVLVRFVGNALHRSDYQRIDAWAERLSHWLSHGLQAAYFFIHQRRSADAVPLAERLVGQLNTRLGLCLPAPQPQRELFGEQCAT